MTAMNAYYQRVSRLLIYTLVAIIILLLLAVLWCCTRRCRLAEPVSAAIQFPFFQKGVTYADWSKESYLSFAADSSLQELSKTNAQWVALIVTWYQDRYDSIEIKPTYRTPSDASVIHAIEKIHALGMKVMLKPQLDLIDTSAGRWRGEIEFVDPSLWQAWFNNYRNFISHYLEIADMQDVELFCLGTELTSSALNYPQEWQKIILYARQIYRGNLTYAANWHKEYSGISFWDLLDYAGVDPYFPLTATKTPTVKELKLAWQPWVKELEAWQSRINRPVLFTEIGYKSCEAAADNPWEYIPRSKLDLKTQANCYQALLETFYHKRWLWGIYWWYWQVAINPQLSVNREFPFRGKPAEAIVTKWYRKTRTSAGKAYYPRISREAISLRGGEISLAANQVAQAPKVTAGEGLPSAVTQSAAADVSFKVEPALPKAVSVHSPVWQKGMCYMTWNDRSLKNDTSDESLALLKNVGAQWVALSPTWYQERYDSFDIRPREKTPTDESLMHAIEEIHALGMKVMLKPHVDLINQEDGRWRGEIEFISEEGWESWFKSYADFILHYAELAKDKGVELFCIGTELTRPATTQPKRWRDLIPQIRKRYPGPLTYAANWYEEYSLINFWDLLDYAGVDPYFPLLEKERPTLEEIKAAWKLWEGLLEEWQAKINKPVIFPEIGYKSSTYTTDQPWLALPGKDVDLRLQKDCYQAVLEIFWDKPWFYGVYWWYWGTHPAMGGENNRGYTPQNKPAQELLKDWYSKSAPHQ